MRKFIFVAVLFFTSSAFADSVAQMVDQCNKLMECRECQWANTFKTFPSGTRPILINNKKYEVSTAEYEYVRGVGYAKTNDGKWLMCVRTEEAMLQPESERGKVARASFRADFDGRRYCPGTTVAELFDRDLQLASALFVASQR